MPQPIVGDVVHYFAQDLTRPVAAIITDVRGDHASLQLFLPPGASVGADVYVQHSTEPTPGHWTEHPTS